MMDDAVKQFEATIDYAPQSTPEEVLAMATSGTEAPTEEDVKKTQTLAAIILGWKQVKSPAPGTVSFTKGALIATIGKDGSGRWHMQLSAHKRKPALAELQRARFELLPRNAIMAHIIPPTTVVDKAGFHLVELVNLEKEKAT